MLALAACGPEDIASPGTGGNVIINNPAPTPAPTPTPTPGGSVTAANGCPTIADAQGLSDEGTISGPTGEYRVCAMPARFNTSSTLPYVEGLLYRMAGRVDVGTDGGPTADASDGASDTNVTLTIEPGAMIYASGSSFLMVNRGNKINAVGTASRPILFTSRDNVLGLNNENSSGQWGGVVLAGRAPVTDCIAPGATPGTTGCERQVEGAAQPALFGGATPDDSSGRMSYVQIRYSGFVLSGDSELQSLTTGGSGSGTQLDHIMSYNSSDDGVEFFGGRVNLKNLIVVGAEDDSIDTDTGVKANLQYVIAVQREGAGDTIIEADSSNGLENSTPRQNTQISNATFIHRNASSSQAIRIRGGTDYALVNSVVVAPSGVPCIRLDDTATIQTSGADERGAPRFNSVVLDCASNFRDGGDVSASQAQAIFDAGSNNNKDFTNTLSMLFINGSNENGAVAFDPTALSSFFDNVNFIGAVRDSANNWTTGWTCNSAAISFGSNVGTCTSLPIY
nr:hypothetical protein [Croceicoccus hydrothermalis]